MDTCLNITIIEPSGYNPCVSAGVRDSPAVAAGLPAFREHAHNGALRRPPVPELNLTVPTTYSSSY